jgi:hypothetical protein
LNLGQSNRNFKNSKGDWAKDDEMTLQDEKISHLKEQIMVWKIRACRAEERVTRLIQMREREIKATHDIASKAGRKSRDQAAFRTIFPRK